MTMLENCRESLIKPSSPTRQEADRVKANAYEHSRDFNLHYIQELTMLPDDARQLWSAYFSAYYAGRVSSNDRISDGYLDSMINHPFLALLWGPKQDLQDGRELAWIELKNESECLETAYQKKQNEQPNHVGVPSSQAIKLSANAISSIYAQRKKMSDEQLHKKISEELSKLAPKLTDDLEL